MVPCGCDPNLMQNNRKRYWFPAKRYGWGWGLPSTWEGWLVFILFIAVVSILSVVMEPNGNPSLFSASVIGCAAVLIGICYAKGEPPRWRWGKPATDEKETGPDGGGNGG